MGKSKLIITFLFCLSTAGIILADEPNDCNEVHFYGYGYDSDYNKDCRVDAADLNEITSYWLEDYTPQEPNLPPSPPEPPPCKKTLYIDGVLIGDANAPERLTWPIDRITIGSEGNRWYMYNEYVGKLDDFSIYEGALSAAQVAAHWNARSSYTTYQAVVTADNPLLWLKLDETDTNDGMVANNSAGIIDGTYVARGPGVVIKPTAGFVAGSNGVELNVNGRMPKMGEANGVCIDVWDGDGVFGEDLDGDVTIELWANYTDLNDYPRFFQHNGSWDEDGSYGLSTPLNDGNTLAVMGGGATNFMDFDNDINDGQWHHIVVTYDSYIQRIYADLYEQVVMSDDPVLYLRFSYELPIEDYSHSYWIDSSSSVTIEEVPCAVDRFAAHLNGGWIAAANQQTEPCLPTDYNHLYAFSPDDLTVEFWLYSPDANEDDFASLFTQCQGELEYAPGATRAGSKCRMLFGDNRPEPNGYVDTNDGAWKSDQDWHHFVVVWNEIPDTNGNPYQINIKWYTDNILYKNVTYGPDVAKGYLGPEMDHILIGRLGSRDDISGAPYQGYIDEFAVYPYVLSEDRIEAHYLAWQPWDCYQLWFRQLMPPWAALIDKNQDCLIDFYDFAEFALEWALCNDPQGGAGCVPNW
jgi:hypothetical protein